MERKIADQKKLIEHLYDDLESREKFIEKLQEDLKDNYKRNNHSKKQLESEKNILEEKVKETLKIVNVLKGNTSPKCVKGCDKYKQSIDDVYEAGVKHRSKVVELKKIDDEQKVKLSCLRKHRDEKR